VLTRTMKYISIAALVLAVAFWNSAYAYERILGFVIATGAVLVAAQAARAKKHLWTIGFYVIAFVFNPFLPAGVFSGGVAFSIVTATFGFFTCSLYALKTQPLLSLPSITDRNPGSHSL
jgi:hypothetical protein